MSLLRKAHIIAAIMCAMVILLVAGEARAALRGDVWAYDFADETWTKLSDTVTSPTGPGTRRMHSGLYDPVGDRLLIFSGLGDFTTSSPAWAFDLTSNSWSRYELAEGSDPFPVLNSEQVFYDEAHHRVILADTGYSVKVLDLNARTIEPAPDSTWPHTHRQYPAQAYDPVRQRLYTYGGWSSSTGIRSDLHVYDFLSTGSASRWTEIAQSGDLPGKKYLAQAYVDTHRDVMVLFGGNWTTSFDYAEYTDEVYELDLKSLRWTRSTAPARPSRRGQFAAGYDGGSRRGFVFGGLFRAGGAWANVTTFNEIWTCSKSGAWTLELPRGPICPPRRLPVAAYDSSRNRLVVYGGEEIQGSQSGARAEVKVPQNGARVNGNRVLVMAELASGSAAMTRDVLFEYRAPSITGTWMPVPAADSIGHPNPDSTAPWFIHWDVTTLTSGTVDLRAVATDTSNRSDTAPAMITVTIDPEAATSVQEVVDGSFLTAHRVSADLGADAASASLDGTGANVLVRMPGNSLTTDSQVQIRFVAADDPDLFSLPQFTGYAVDVTLSSGQTAFASGSEPMLLLHYRDSNNDGLVDGTSIPESALRIYRVGPGGTLTALADPYVDTQRNNVRGRTSTFSRFVLLGTDSAGVDGFRQYD